VRALRFGEELETPGRGGSLVERRESSPEGRGRFVEMGGRAERGRKLWPSGFVFLAKGSGVGFGLFLAKVREAAAVPW
jgi:hypothetical protein